MALFDLHNPGVFAFGILGNIVSLFVFLAPLPTFIRICKTKSTMGFQSLPYVVALFSSMLWMYYALIKVDAVLLISINAIGCIVETIYITIYLIYATTDARKHAVRLVAGVNVGLFSMIFLGTAWSTHGPIRVAVVGWICVAVSVSVFAAPLSIVFQVVRTKSVEFMPFPLSFFLTLSAVMWFAYGLLQRDLCVALPNVLGFFLGILQMLLYGIYRNGNKEVMEPEKKVPEHVINIVKLSNPEVHPVDSPVSVESDNEVEAGGEEKENIEDEFQTWDEKCVSGPGPDEDERLSPIVNVKPMESPVLIMCTA